MACGDRPCHPLCIGNQPFRSAAVVKSDCRNTNIDLKKNVSARGLKESTQGKHTFALEIDSIGEPRGRLRELLLPRTVSLGGSALPSVVSWRCLEVWIRIVEWDGGHRGRRLTPDSRAGLLPPAGFLFPVVVPFLADFTRITVSALPLFSVFARLFVVSEMSCRSS